MFKILLRKKFQWFPLGEQEKVWYTMSKDCPIQEVVFLGIMDLLEEMNDWTEEETQTPIPPEESETPLEEPAEAEPSLIVEKAILPDAPVLAAVAPPPRQRRSIAVYILAAITLLCGLVLAMTVVVCLPYFEKTEDPEIVMGHFSEFQVTEAAQETILEPTISETAEATIPPARNPYDRYDFQYDRHNYLLLQNAKSSPGVDVSAFQGDIDWAAVRASGIEFAMIRLGFRGYESGKLVEDEYARDNLREAAEAGLKVGAYFFSQAVTIKEADEELAFMEQVLDGFGLTMPLVLDWEIPADNARTKNMDKRTLTDIQRHFCAQAKKRGYIPMVYFNWHQSENLYVLHELEEYPFWLALYQDRMTYPWKIKMWQWTDKGRVPGISGPVDLNVYLHY